MIFKSTKELLEHIASNHLLEFEHYIIYSWTESNFTWKGNKPVNTLSKSSKEVEQILGEFFVEDIIIPNIEYYSQFTINPQMNDGEVVLQLFLQVSTMVADSFEKDGKLPIKPYLKDTIKKLNLIPELKGITADSFDDQLRYTCQSDDHWFEFYDKSQGQWISMDEVPYADHVLAILGDLYNKLNDELDLYAEFSIIENEIHYHKEDQMMSSMVVSGISLHTLDDGVEYELQ